jgi:Na+-driven multidrug efflux pump
VAVGAVFALALNIFAYPVCEFLGADETTMDNAVRYVRIVYGCTPVHLLSIVLISFYPACGKPQMGLFSSILNGALNIILDVVLIPVMHLGVTGSSLSTVIGDAGVVIAGLIFYSMKKQEIHFVKPVGEFIHTILLSCRYAMSQFVNSMSLSVFNLVTNRVILATAGADGIAANAIVGDLRRILNSAISGYAGCVAPVIAYNCGSRNYRRLKRIFNYNLTYWFFMSGIVTALGLLLRRPLIGIFFKEDYSQTVYDLTLEGLTVEFSGIALTTGCILLNRMFVAMNEVKVATFTSFMRNIVFRVLFTLTLPFLLGMMGIWLSFTASEVFSFTLAAVMFVRCLPRFNLSGKDLHFAIHED